MLFMSLLVLFAHFLLLTESNPGNTESCQARKSAVAIARNVGDSIQMRCLANSTCQGTSYLFYHHNLDTGQFELVHQGSHIVTIHINHLDDSGEYYCIKECARNAANQHRCYWNVTVPPVVRCNVSETAVLNQSISGSSIAIGSPRPLTRVIMSLHCNYHTKLTVVNNYTTMVEFTIPQVSRYCQDIYCYAANDQTAIVTKQLNFTESQTDKPNNSDSEQDMHSTVVPKEETFTKGTTIKETTTEEATTNADSDRRKSYLPVGNRANSVTVASHVLFVKLVFILYQ